MDLVFKHLEHRCEQGQLAGAWATLLHTFEQSILDTHRSKFTQYLLWYMCRQASSHSHAQKSHPSALHHVCVYLPVNNLTRTGLTVISPCLSHITP